MRVKICGIRRRDDALEAARLGADAVGVLVGQNHPSAHFVSAAEARAILEVLPPFVSGVLVSHVTDPAELKELIEQVKPAAVQIHSTMALEDVAQVRRLHPGLSLLKSVHINGQAPFDVIRGYAPVVDGLVADSLNPTTGQVGGTGLTHDWSTTATLAKQTEVPMLLAGGSHLRTWPKQSVRFSHGAWMSTVASKRLMAFSAGNAWPNSSAPCAMQHHR